MQQGIQEAGRRPLCFRVDVVLGSPGGLVEVNQTWGAGVNRGLAQHSREARKDHFSGEK